MSVTEKFSRYFASSVRDRGAAYYRQGRVHLKAVDGQRLDARVRGSENYKVIFDVHQNELQVSCTCPYFDEDFCKHIWATLLEAKDDGRFAYVLSNIESLTCDDDDLEDDYADGYEIEYDSEYDSYSSSRYQSRARKTNAAPAAKPASTTTKPGNWMKTLDSMKESSAAANRRQPSLWPTERQVFYVIDIPASIQSQGLLVELWYRDPKKNGDWGKLQRLSLGKELVAQIPDSGHQEIFSRLLGAGTDPYNYYSTNFSRFKLYHPAQTEVIRLMCATGHCHLKLASQNHSQAAPELTPQPLAWDDGAAWQFCLRLGRDESENNYFAEGVLQRDGQVAQLSEPVLLIAGGLIFWRDRIALFDDNNAFQWIGLLRREGRLTIPAPQRDAFFEKLIVLPAVPRLELPDELAFEEVCLTPTPTVIFKLPPGPYHDYLPTEFYFDYGGAVFDSAKTERGVFDSQTRQLVLRDTAFEQQAEGRLKQLGCRSTYQYWRQSSGLELNRKNLPRAVKTLLQENWRVEAEGKLYRQAGGFRLQVSSGIDWFGVSGEMQFGEVAATLPALIEALRRGENTVLLDDGTFGILPEDWLQKYRLFAGLGEAKDDELRFTKSQTGLLDALLASQPEATFDAGFARAREELQSFAGIEAADAPSGFTGVLRDYQRQGLGWLRFLQQFGFGGCLADDMGLGKTIEVLSLLESRRQLRNPDGVKNARANGRKHQEVGVKPPAPSLVVVPKTLVFNWKQEAARFTPKLRVLDHTGGFRKRATDHFDEYDLIITTYGTLRRDVLQFKDFQFDYVILDESQAIKNASTESAKAARLLCGDYKLALSGTPIENHLGELWSLFEFLNPGLLGNASVFKLTGAGGRTVDPEARELLAKGLRPFILRRTKEQVAKDLPEKLEQTIYCELDKEQRKQYNELRTHYRAAILGLIEQVGIRRSKIQVLEALLRLRQAACHPGLIDKKRVIESSAKLDLLMNQLQELHDAGHKVLVFSQFTSFLSIVRNRLDKEQIAYEYLDGRTRDRQAKVERFQNDSDCRLFLISLKAGGVGLNLTAAEYVFLLDPWWNPAVEAQAIDRAHRIGQTQKVFAYRLIARDTVEEKVLELQNTKRDLADAIIKADNSLISSLIREDLDLLLS